jgi:hypothetical protein
LREEEAGLDYAWLHHQVAKGHSRFDLMLAVQVVKGHSRFDLMLAVQVVKGHSRFDLMLAVQALTTQGHHRPRPRRPTPLTRLPSFVLTRHTLSPGG